MIDSNSHDKKLVNKVLACNICKFYLLFSAKMTKDNEETREYYNKNIHHLTSHYPLFISEILMENVLYL